MPHVYNHDCATLTNISLISCYVDNLWKLIIDQYDNYVVCTFYIFSIYLINITVLVKLTITCLTNAFMIHKRLVINIIRTVYKISSFIYSMTNSACMKLFLPCLLVLA